jgi:hypothetical protein
MNSFYINHTKCIAFRSQAVIQSPHESHCSWQNVKLSKSQVTFIEKQYFTHLEQAAFGV